MITLKSLAEELGLSIGTVSMALNNSPKIHPDTIKRVESLAKKRNYAPNHFGRALQSGKSRIIGCFVSSLQGSFFGVNLLTVLVKLQLLMVLELC